MKRNWEAQLDPAQAPALGAEVAAAPVAAGLPRARLPFVELALEEVLVNICHHVYHDQPGPVQLALRKEPGLLLIEIADEGPPFDPTVAEPPRLYLLPAEGSVGGWGLQLIRHFVDELRYRREPGRNLVSLVYRV